MKNRAVVVFTDAELHRQLKVRCVSEGQTMTAVVEALVRGWLEAEAAVEAAAEGKVKQVVTSPRVRSAGLEADTRSGQGRTVSPDVRPPSVAKVCRRCGHEQGAHWVKGCVAGCVCSAQRYVPPAGGDPRSVEEGLA
jgi:hypothetical protein